MEKSAGRRSVGERKNAIAALLAVILIIMGAVIIVLSFGNHERPETASETPVEEMDPSKDVLIRDLSLIDPYMITGGAEHKTVRCLASFRDAHGDMCVVSLKIPQDDELYSFLDSYLSDENASVGAYAVNGYFSVKELSDGSPAVLDGFAEACREYAPLLEEGSRLYCSGRVVPVARELTFFCHADDHYLFAKNRENTFSFCVGAAIAVIGLAGLLTASAVGVSEKKKENEKSFDTEVFKL